MTEETFELRFEPEGLQIIPVGKIDKCLYSLQYRNMINF